MAGSKLITGPHLLVYLNGRPFSMAYEVDWRSLTPRVVRAGLDSLEGYEISPIACRVQGTIACYRLHGDGGLEARGVVAPFRHIPREQYFSILIIDRFTGKRVYQADHCMVEEQQWSNKARNKVEGRFSFTGLSWENEAVYE